MYIESPCFSATAYNDSTATAQEGFDLVAALRARLLAQTTLRAIIVTPKVLNFGKPYASYGKFFYQARSAALASLQSAAPDRVIAFHPIGFPGRPLDIRTTVCVVDDAWCSVGTSAIRRRGFTFEGGCDATLTDRQITDGRGAAIAAFRRRLMAQYFGVAAPVADADDADPNWVRLATPRGAFRACQDLVNEGGRGLIEPLWPGPSDSVVIGQTDSRIADPDGRYMNLLIGLLAAFMAAAGNSAA